MKIYAHVTPSNHEKILFLLWIARALHIPKTNGKIFQAAGRYRTERCHRFYVVNILGNVLTTLMLASGGLSPT